MSIIFKALKKAEEESKVERAPVKKTQAYHFGNKKLWGVIIIGIAVLAVSSFAGVYLAKKKTLSKLFAKPSKKVVDIQPKPVPVSPQTAIVPKPQTPVPVSEGTDTVKLHEDAIRFIKDKNYSAAENTLKKRNS